jgi:hypothetical protein
MGGRQQEHRLGQRHGTTITRPQVLGEEPKGYWTNAPVGTQFVAWWQSASHGLG